MMALFRMAPAGIMASPSFQFFTTAWSRDHTDQTRDPASRTTIRGPDPSGTQSRRRGITEYDRHPDGPQEPASFSSKALDHASR